MLQFIVGMMLGAALGIMVAALMVAAKGGGTHGED